MDEISPLYANYNFHKHKGYGTKAHIEVIREFGRSDIHRFSFKSHLQIQIQPSN
jgi:ribonuclease HII